MDIQELQNVYNGLPVFIIGAGTSLNFIDFKIIKDFPSIAINSGIVADDSIDYFLSDDKSVSFWSYFSKDIQELDCFCLLYKKKLKKYSNHISEDRKLFFDHCSKIKMNKDLSQPLIKARTSMATAVNIAYGMGANKIFLLGSDCGLKNNQRYFWESYSMGNMPYKMRGKKYDFYNIKKNNKSNSYFIDKHSNNFLKYWKKFYKYNESILQYDVEIINASYGNLDYFKKIKPEDIKDYI